MDLNHVAVFVDDLEKSAIGPALGGWDGPTVSITNYPVTVGGLPGEHSGRTRSVRTARHPRFGVAIEDVAVGAPIRRVAGDAWHHVAVWCDDVVASVEALEAAGYRREMVGRGPAGELATFAYMVSDRGPRLEVADAAMRERMLGGATAAAGGGQGADCGLNPLLDPFEVTVVVEDVDKLEQLRTSWQLAFGAEWGARIDETVTVDAADGSHELVTCNVSTVRSPRVTIVAADGSSRSLLAPVDVNGWHHVSFASSDLFRDIARLKQFGFRMEFSDLGKGDRPRSFAMMIAPEGTRVKLEILREQ